MLEFRRGDSDESARLSPHNAPVFSRLRNVRLHTRPASFDDGMVVITSDLRFRRLLRLAA